MQKTKILVVDDAFFMRKLLGNTLMDIGYSNIEFAQDGYEAVDKAREMQPEVVTLMFQCPVWMGLRQSRKFYR
nr:response regulator [Acetivibrio straminisolvens]